MARNDINYSDKNKDGIEQRRLILKNHIRCKFGYSIAKDTEVDVTVETINGKKYYRVFYPGSDTLCFQVKEKDFVSLEDVEPFKTDLKVGDAFWMVEISSQEIWKSTIIKLEGNYAFLDKNEGVFRISITKLVLGLNQRSILISCGDHKHAEKIYFSKDKKEIENKALELVLEAKERKINELDRLSKLHSQELTEYELLEKREKEISKLLGKVIS